MQVPNGELRANRLIGPSGTRLLTGRFIPGKPVTLRGLAQELGVSPMPVREVLQRLAAENALEVKANGRVQVPAMTEARFSELLKARALLEPELAEIAAGHLTQKDVQELTRIDDDIDASIVSGDAETYLALNHAFHFHIYRASGSNVILHLVESIWLQFAPFMRIVYGRVGTANLIDHHKEAISAIQRDDTAGLCAAVLDDIDAGMGLLGLDLLITENSDQEGKHSKQN